jgi:hypothetical protein
MKLFRTICLLDGRPWQKDFVALDETEARKIHGLGIRSLLEVEEGGWQRTTLRKPQLFLIGVSV